MNKNLFANWEAPASWHKMTTLECHTGGEPLRIITSGFPLLKGETILEMRRDCQQNHDHLRTALMFEPRGHADMYGCVITPPERPDSDFGVLFLHNEGYSTMCGHAIIALTRVAVEAGVVRALEPVTSLRIDAPCGQIKAYAEIKKGQIRRIYFDNVPSFVFDADAEVAVPGLGTVSYTLAYGGAFYAYVDASSLGLSLRAENHSQIIDAGRRIKQALHSSRAITHPLHADLGFLYGTIFSAPSETAGVHSRNVCIFADGELDRSPTGSGVAGQAAILHAKGVLPLGEKIVIESILGSQFQVSALNTLAYGPHNAIIPRVEGSAHIVGKASFYIDPSDPLQNGFIFR
ncbi:proline racemase family protein [Undibacterium parvum]|uniref:Proline racemase n=1 Tax=Undibacterium parvum TaxID=401471 RepID=A0A3S9HH10_9BURK|nr:proline racemase family protein [Undibacterium parvum]AZP11397.1 proline racemase [Undibacterium parvum]